MSFVSTLYQPIPLTRLPHSIWGIADGSRKVNVDEEIIAYAVLDILAKPVFGAWLLITHQTMPETNVEIGGFWAHGLSGEGAIRVGDDDE